MVKTGRRQNTELQQRDNQMGKKYQILTWRMAGELHGIQTGILKTSDKSYIW